jgi:two-component system sensor kinase FixL
VKSAYEALAETDRQRRVTIRTRIIDDLIEISVHDNGPGIAPNNYGKLLDAFYTTKPSGMGMGLAISRTIAEDHHGRLWASNDNSSGATFHFTLPIEVHQPLSRWFLRT